MNCRFSLEKIVRFGDKRTFLWQGVKSEFDPQQTLVGRLHLSSKCSFNSSGLWLTDVKVCELVPWLSHRESFISGIKDWLVIAIELGKLRP